MKAIDFIMYQVISKKIISKRIDPILCDVCYPPCKDYTVKVFGKRYSVCFPSNSKNILFHREFNYDSLTVVNLTEIEFYKTNNDLLS